MLPSSAIRVACSRVSSRFGAAKITPASTTRATRMICQRGRLTIGREAFGLAVEAPAGRQGPRLGSGLVVGLAAEAEQSVQQALRLRSEEHTSELQSLMRSSYAVFCLQKNNKLQTTDT